MIQNQKPNDATHVSNNGNYYKQSFHGKKEWWYVQHQNGWFALSGKPTYPLTKL